MTGSLGCRVPGRLGLRHAADDVWQSRAPGTYLLLLRLTEAANLTIGHLGQHRLPAGWYVYVGSALGGLGARLRRHARAAKPRHWHVDVLREAAELVGVAVHVGPERLECAAAARVAGLTGARRPVPRFGASDCRCPAHLVHFDDAPSLRLDASWTVIQSLPPA